MYLQKKKPQVTPSNFKSKKNSKIGTFMSRLLKIRRVIKRTKTIKKMIPFIKKQKGRENMCFFKFYWALIILTHYFCCLKLALSSPLSSIIHSLSLSLSLSLSTQRTTQLQAPIWKEFHAPQNTQTEKRERERKRMNDRG